MSVLTVEQVRKFLKSGMTDAEIGAKVGHHRTTIQQFRKTHHIPAARPVGKTRRGEAPAFEEVAVGEYAPAPSKKTLSVAEFLLNKRKAVCPVCQLKDPIKVAVMDAKKKGERTADILEYLQVCHRITIQPRDYTVHFSSRHDQ